MEDESLARLLADSAFQSSFSYWELFGGFSKKKAGRLKEYCSEQEGTTVNAWRVVKWRKFRDALKEDDIPRLKTSYGQAEHQPDLEPKNEIIQTLRLWYAQRKAAKKKRKRKKRKKKN